MLRTVLAALATTVLAPALAHAEEPSSQQPWDNVSHINGQLVKVGERNEYLKSGMKRVNLSTNPVGWLFGFYGLSAAVAVSDNVTVRGNIEKLHYEFFGSVDGHEMSLSAPIYLRRAFSGPFLEPGVYHRETSETDWDLFGDGETPYQHTATGAMVLAGWHWTYDSGFNFAFALGGRRAMSDTVDGQAMTESPEPEMTGYVRVGYAF
ncbi:MAG TPA: hypothetical protein VM513_27340 [Kofleriaceae bacterium]|nr:hypothetical protein [Kofleriaceae bacterium]